MKIANMPHVSSARVISTEEEKVLTAQYKAQPTKQLAEKIINGNIKYVAKIAHQFTRKYANFTFEDFFQEGMIGMKVALDKFDPEKCYNYPNARFTSYAKLWIIAHMQKFIINNWSAVTADNTNLRKRFFGKLENTEHNYFDKNESRLPLGDVSLNKRRTPDSKAELGETLMDDKPQPEESYSEVQFNYELKVAFEKLLESFDERDQYVIRNRFLTDEPMTLNEIGEKYGLSRERIRQIEERCLAKLTKLAKNSVEMENFIDDMVA